MAISIVETNNECALTLEEGKILWQPGKRKADNSIGSFKLK